jgi:hypothetical protein
MQSDTITPVGAILAQCQATTGLLATTPLVVHGESVELSRTQTIDSTCAPTLTEFNISHNLMEQGLQAEGTFGKAEREREAIREVAPAKVLNPLLTLSPRRKSAFLFCFCLAMVSYVFDFV